MQEEPFRYAPQELSTPGAQIIRNQDEFSHFIVAYDKLRKERTHADALLAAKALIACVLLPGDGEDGLIQATAMLDKLLKGEVKEWVVVFKRAIECGIDAEVFTTLKKLFSPDPSRLLVVMQVAQGDSVTLIGKDAPAFWDALLTGRHAHRTAVIENKASIHMLESNGKMWL